MLAESGGASTRWMSLFICVSSQYLSTENAHLLVAKTLREPDLWSKVSL
jgi:hypothetical protein